MILPKKDGSLRVCIDFRIDDLLERIGRTNIITTLDQSIGTGKFPWKSSREP